MDVRLHSINRGVAIIKPKQPYLDWADSLPDPTPITLEQMRQDCTAILIPEVYSNEAALRYVRKLAPILFENELAGWMTDDAWWPKQRDWRTFKKWFDVEIHSVVLDTVWAAIVKDPTEW